MNNLIKQQKKELRKAMLAKRTALTAETLHQQSINISEQLINLAQQISARRVHCYLPMPGEINIRPFIQYLLDQNILVATPQALSDKSMRNLQLTDLNNVEAGIFGTSHPTNGQVISGKFDLIVIPGLAFDYQNFRLGFGAGYYDRFLIKQPQALKTGLAFPFQLVEKVPLEEHDIALDRVLI